MSAQDWTHIGEEIVDSLNQAINTGDFSQMSDTIKKTAKEAYDSFEAKRYYDVTGAHKASERFGPGPRNDRYHGTQTRKASDRVAYRTAPPRVKSVKFAQASTLETKYKLLNVGGALAAGFGFISEFVCTLLGGLGLPMGGGMLLSALPLAGGGFLIYKGVTGLKRVRRFRKYANVIGDRDYISIKDLAFESGIDEKTVKEDVKKMIEKGWFLKGFEDEGETILILTEEAKLSYLQAYNSYKERQRADSERVKAQTMDETIYKDLPEEVKSVLTEGREFVRQIRKANDAIPGVEISEKISRLEKTTDQIFDNVERHPELTDNLRKFMKYYLPTTVKLLNAYEELDREAIQGPNVMKSKAEIEGTLDTINEAFETLLDSFFEDDAVDIKSDIDVMQTLMAQEGLLGR